MIAYDSYCWSITRIIITKGCILDTKPHLGMLYYIVCNIHEKLTHFLVGHGRIIQYYTFYGISYSVLSASTAGCSTYRATEVFFIKVKRCTLCLIRNLDHTYASYSVSIYIIPRFISGVFYYIFVSFQSKANEDK